MCETDGTGLKINEEFVRCLEERLLWKLLRDWLPALYTCTCTPIYTNIN